MKQDYYEAAKAVEEGLGYTLVKQREKERENKRI